METVGTHTLWSFDQSGDEAVSTTCTAIRKQEGKLVSSFMDLAQKVAELQFLNRDLVLMFRGQSGDYKNKSGLTTLKPRIFRPIDPAKVPKSTTLAKRYSKLNKAETDLIEIYKENKLTGFDRLQRQQILRWSLLQHYEICDTPLIDVTHSLRIAASFASIGADQSAYIFVLGVPQMGGAITASADAGLQVIRLPSVCPPCAIRPHIQEGYLLGEYPEMAKVDQKLNYKHFEIDFGRRIVAKFRFEPEPFWRASENFPQFPFAALYPNENDPLYKIAESIKSRLSNSN